MTPQERPHQKAWIGIALVIFGGYFLLRNFDMIPAIIPYYLFSWKSILIIIGGSMLITGRKEGIIFLAIGSFFLLPDLFFMPYFQIRDWWPLILIIIGIVIILRRRDHVNRRPGDSSDDFVDETSIFGGSEKSFSSQNFRGGKITSIFGGSEIDFSEAKMQGDEIIIDVFCMFGGNNMIIPNEWTVINETFVIFGGVADKRRRSASKANNLNKVLRIKGLVIFGGAEIKSA